MWIDDKLYAQRSATYVVPFEEDEEDMEFEKVNWQRDGF
jgi:hypothetical protein